MGSKRNLALLVSSLILVGASLDNCTGYVPNSARSRWGMEEMQKNEQLKDDATVDFDNIPYLVSWEKKYSSPAFDSLGGLRSTQATYDRLRYSMARKFYQIAGENSEPKKQFNDLMMTDIIKNPQKAEVLYEKMFGKHGAAFDERNLVDQKLLALADEVKNDLWIYPNPKVTNMLQNNDLLNMTLAHLERPELKELDYGYIRVEFPGSFGEYLMQVDNADRSSKNSANPARQFLASKVDKEREFGKYLMGVNVSEYSDEVFRQYFNWNKTVDVQRTDTLRAQILNVMRPQVDSGFSGKANKVGVEVNYYFPLNKVGVQNGALRANLECVVKNMDTGEEVIYGKKAINESVKGLPFEGVYNIKFFIPEIHEIDSINGKGGKSNYQITSRITTPIGERIANSFFELPTDRSYTPVWDMQRLILSKEGDKKQFYSLEKIAQEGDSLLFEVPVTGAFPYVGPKGDTTYSSSIHLYWEPDKRKGHGDGSVTLGEVIPVDFVPTDTLGEFPETKHEYNKGDSTTVGHSVAFGSSPNYVTKLPFKVPRGLDLGKGKFRAIVMSYDYENTKREININDAIWKGIIEEK